MYTWLVMTNCKLCEEFHFVRRIKGAVCEKFHKGKFVNFLTIPVRCVRGGAVCEKFHKQRQGRAVSYN